MNVPCDSPIDFYASAPKGDGRKSVGGIDRPKTSESAPITRKTSWLMRLPSIRINNSDENDELFFAKPLFIRRKLSKKLSYLPDGRRVFNGELVEACSANKLWEQLLVRSLVHRIEEEVASPAQRLFIVQEKLASSKGPGCVRGNERRSSSTYSLVSDARVKGACEKCGSEEGRARSVSVNSGQPPSGSYTGVWFSFDRHHGAEGGNDLDE